MSKLDSATSETTSSNFRRFSIGIVAANKLRGSRVIEVTPIERLQMLDGELTDHVDTLETEGVESDGSSYHSKVTVGNSIQAEWIPMGSGNRDTAPDVRRGELVQIYQFADADVYHWDTLKDDTHLRRLETVRYVFNADPKAATKDDGSNAYFFEVSTHDKSITLQTSKTNGEPYKYTFQLDLEQGKFVLSDDVGNYIAMVSEKNIVELRNAANSYYQLNNEDINFYCPGNYTGYVGGTYDVRVADNAKMDVSGLYQLLGSPIKLN